MRKLLFISTMFFASCYTQKRAEKEITKAYIQHPSIVAAKARNWFPCVPLLTYRDTGTFRVNDSTIIKIVRFTDTLQYVIRDSVKSDRKLLLRQLNNATNIIETLQRELQKKPAEVYIKDSAELYNLNFRIAQLTQDKEKYMQKNERRLMMILYLLIFLCVTIILYTLRNEILKKGG